MDRLKLELVKHDLPYSECFRARFVPGDLEISSTGLFLKEMNDHTGPSHSEDEITRGLFDQFSRCFVPDGSVVYAILRYSFRKPFRNEYIARLDELRRSGFEFVTEREAVGKIGLRYRLLFWRIHSGAINVKDAGWEDLSRWYRESESWRSTCFMFLVSPVAIEEWINELARLSMGSIDKGFLRRTGRILFNHFEHGMETIGLGEPPETLEKAAKALSQRFNLPLQIVEARDKAKPSATPSNRPP